MPGLSLVDSGCPSKLPGSRLAQNPQLNFSLPSTRVQGLTSLQAWHPSSWLMQPLRLVFSFDHLTSALFGPSTSLNAPSLADPGCRPFSASDHTQNLLPLLPFQKPPDLLRARSLLGLRIRTSPLLKSGSRGLPGPCSGPWPGPGPWPWPGPGPWPWPGPCSKLVLYVQALFCAI